MARALALPWVLALLLAAPLALLPATASACGGASVEAAAPCGRIYPLLLVQVPEEPGTLHPVAARGALSLQAAVTYTFDAGTEGYTVATPNEPVFVTFEFPRKPGWVDMRVEPERFEVPVNDPRHLKVDPVTQQATFVHTTPITIHVAVTGQAVLRDGFDYAKLLVFAKSTESGLYQSGYGIKEVRLVPEGALHESDVAGQRDVFVASPLPPLAIVPTATTVLGTTVAVEPAGELAWWEPSTLRVQMEPARPGRMMATVHDETGAMIARQGPYEMGLGAALVNVTFVRPGLHTLALTAIPEPTPRAPPMTFVVPLDLTDHAAEGHVFPKKMLVATREVLPAPSANTQDPLAQFERDVPFFAFDTAQGVTAIVRLQTPSIDPSRAFANVQFSLHDPDGRLLQAATVDPTTPERPMRVGSVPQEGWYVLRLKGVGLLAATVVDARVEVAYGKPPQMRDRADGVPDLTLPSRSFAGTNLTFPLDSFRVWTPGDATPDHGGIPNRRFLVTAYDANGSLVYASGLRTGRAAFTPPAPGDLRAFVVVEPTEPGTPFSPVVGAFAFRVGEGTTTTARAFPVEDAPEAPTTPNEAWLAVHALPFLDPAAKGAGGGDGVALDVVDETGAPTPPSAPGTYWLRAAAANPGAPKAVPFAYAVEHPTPLTFVGPGGEPEGRGRVLPVPGVAIAAALGLAGGVAVTVALLRKK